MSKTGKSIDFTQLAVELVETIKKYPRLLIYIKGSPDPDALGGAYALKLLCDIYGTTGTIISPQEASLPQNIKIIKDLRLPIHFKAVEECQTHYDAYAVLDHQSVSVDGLSGVIPCALHIDHHKAITDEIPVGLRIQMEAPGSTSTIVIHLLKALNIGFHKAEWRNAATALYYGIQTDTDNFQHAGEPDHQAVAIISPYIDKALLDQVNALPFNKETTHFFHQALLHRVIYKEWLIAGIGYIDEKNRDTLGIIADFLLKREDIVVVVVFGIVAKNKQLVLDASFRTKDEELNLNTLIKKITKEGGARKFKGAYQVNLDYFTACPDRDLLWNTVYATTLETLKKSRDDVHSGELEKLYGFLRKKIQELFH